jgi:predicted O-linked N-acetylglucosamine transferase (SPINDLY family)
VLKEAVSRIRGTWRECAGLSERQLAEAIRADHVDVLVELTGHTANNRLGTMALRPAPVQVTWIGYPNSTGLTSVDYRLTDAIADPVDTRQTFTERLVRIPELRSEQRSARGVPGAVRRGGVRHLRLLQHARESDAGGARAVGAAVTRGAQLAPTPQGQALRGGALQVESS